MKREVCVLSWNATLVFGMGPRFKILSSLIFRQLIWPPSKFSKPVHVIDWEGLSKYFELHVDLSFSDWTGNLLSILSLILFGLWSSWVYCWTAWSPREDHHKYPEMQFRTILWFICQCVVEPVESSIFLLVIVELMQKWEHTPCVWENMTLIWYVTVTFCVFGRDPHQWRRDPHLIVVFETRRLCWRVLDSFFV